VWRMSLILLILLPAACITEVKPLLKPVKVDVPTRIAEQQKWLDQDITGKVFSPQEAKPIREKITKIKENYDRLQTAGELSPKDSEMLNRMLDESSEMIFDLVQKHHKGTGITGR